MNSCRQLYYALVLLLRGRAFNLAYNVGVGKGLKTYWKRNEIYHPWVASRYICGIRLSTRFFSHDLEAELETFDKTVRRYETETGKRIDDKLLGHCSLGLPGDRRNGRRESHHGTPGGLSFSCRGGEDRSENICGPRPIVKALSWLQKYAQIAHLTEAISNFRLSMRP